MTTKQLALEMLKMRQAQKAFNDYFICKNKNIKLKMVVVAKMKSDMEEQEKAMDLLIHQVLNQKPKIINTPERVSIEDLKWICNIQ